MPRLVLRVNYGGAKVWRALHYVTKHKDGKRVSILTTYKLGVYPHLKLKDAREAARKFSRRSAEGAGTGGQRLIP